SAVGVLERLGLMDDIAAAGGVRSRTRVLTRWGWMEPPADTKVPANLNLRRERLDPLIRAAAAEQDGLELILGHKVDRVLERGGAPSRYVARGGSRRCIASSRAPASRPPATRRWRATRCGAWAAASRYRPASGWPTASRPRCSARSRSRTD